MAASNTDESIDPAPDFDLLRPNLRRAAYRMLGSVADAEDIAHETIIRWLPADHTHTREPRRSRLAGSRAFVSTN
jgi:DNA-directed RNA polymerase specialized sigma24 family protein